MITHCHTNSICSARRPWYNKFRATLNHCQEIAEIETLLRGKVTRWRGRAGEVLKEGDDSDTEDENSDEEEEEKVDGADIISSAGIF